MSLPFPTATPAQQKQIAPEAGETLWRLSRAHHREHGWSCLLIDFGLIASGAGTLGVALWQTLLG